MDVCGFDCGSVSYTSKWKWNDFNDIFGVDSHQTGTHYKSIYLRGRTKGFLLYFGECFHEFLVVNAAEGWENVGQRNEKGGGRRNGSRRERDEMCENMEYIGERRRLGKMKIGKGTLT